MFRLKAISNQLQATLFESDPTSLLEGFPASPLARMDGAAGSMMLDTSGRKCLEWLKQLNQPTLFRKMLVGHGLFSMKYVPRWSLLGTQRNRVLLRLLASERTISVSDIGLYPTPRATEIINGASHIAQRDHPSGLTSFVNVLEGLPAQTTNMLNPVFVESLMGYPEGWTDLDHSVTP